MQKLIKEAREIAYDENRKTQMPVKEHIDLSTRIAIKLAKRLNADVEIVEIGSLMMDCMIGQSLKEGRLEDHVKMSFERTKELLQDFKIPDVIKENILKCVEEHHGVDKFHSVESEICCNADCYRFISIKGFIYTIRYIRDMNFFDLVKLLKKKSDEKWNALSLDICEDELRGQYELIQRNLKYLLND